MRPESSSLPVEVVLVLVENNLRVLKGFVAARRAMLIDRPMSALIFIHVSSSLGRHKVWVPGLTREHSDMHMTCQTLMALGLWGLRKRLVKSTAALPIARLRSQSTLLWLSLLVTLLLLAPTDCALLWESRLIIASFCGISWYPVTLLLLLLL